MSVPMVSVRKMHVLMLHGVMPVPVSVRALCGHGIVVLVLVVFVVFVFMFVLNGLMHMLVNMMLGEMQPHPYRHQCGSQNQGPGERVTEAQGERGAKERRDREIGASTRGAKMPQADNEQGQADAVGGKAQ